MESIRNLNVCYDCGCPIRDEKTLSCPHCHKTDTGGRRARPSAGYYKAPKVQLPFPWNEIEVKHGATILLTGDKGSGKTSICMKLKPAVLASSEQQPDQVAATWDRIHQGNEAFPLITSCTTLEELQEDLINLSEGDIGIVDSISQLAGHHSEAVMKDAIERARQNGYILVFIAQYTKDGGMLGPNSLNHMVDVCAEIPVDKRSGLRRLTTNKNRFGNLSQTYFRLGPHGPEEQMFMEGVYTVEGSPGNYDLVLYGARGAEFTGIFDQFAKIGIPADGFASAAFESRVYKAGFAQPGDWRDRKRFAEKHGLKWLEPMDAMNRILECTQSDEENT